MGPATDQVSTFSQASDLDRGADIASDELRSDIEATRSGMSDTVEAIQAKLSPQNVQEMAEQITERAKQAALEVVDQATEKVRETVTQLKNEVKTEIHDATIGRVERMVGNMKDTTRDASSTIVETIKANPIPAALVGIGLAWLFMNKSSSAPTERRYSAVGYGYNPQGNSPQGYGHWNNRYQEQGTSPVDAVQQKAGQVMDSVSEAAEHVKERAGEFVDQAQTKVEHLSDRVQDQAQNVMYRSQGMFEDNPLMTGALALALGAAVGLLLPETQRENELMGDARDKFMGQVSEAAHETLDKAQKVATETLHTAADKAQEEAKAQGLTSKQPM